MTEIAGVFSPELLPPQDRWPVKCVKKDIQSYQSNFFSDPNCMFLQNDHDIVCIDNQYIIFYGEIYNKEQITKRLKDAGIYNVSDTDAALMLKGWCQWQHYFLNEINGVFSFIIYDKDTNKLFFARDHFGVKPLYYAIRENIIYLASTLSKMLSFPEIQPNLNTEGILEIMLLGPGKIPGSGVFQDVYEVKPGQWGYFDENGLHLDTYWALKDSENQDNYKTCLSKTREMVEASIVQQLSFDIPMGSFLSGGLDSSIVSTVASKYLGEIDTFSLDYEGNDKYFTANKFQPNSDQQFIRIMEQHLGAKSHHIVLEPEAPAKALYDALKAREYPGMADVDSALLLLCRKTKDSCRLVLSGECADELFGGYPWFRDPALRASEGFPWSQTTEYRAGFLSEDVLKNIDAKEYVAEKYNSALKTVDILPGTSAEEKRTKELMALNINWFMQTLIIRNDRMATSAGITIRTPFSNRNIAEYLYSVPWSYKNKNGREKGLLRDAFRDVLPKEIIDRKKSPFPKTWNPKYRQFVTNMLREELKDPACPLLTILNKNALLKLCDDDRSIPWYGQLMTTPQTIAYFVQLSYWLKLYRVNILL